MKKACVCLLSLLVCLSLVLPAGAAAYPDLDESHWAYEQMDAARSCGVITGLPDGSMAPDATLSWGQYLTMLARAFYSGGLSAAPSDPAAHWAQGALQAALEEGVLLSGDFLDFSNLDAPLTRQDAAVLLFRLLPEERSDWWWTPPDAAAELSDFAALPAQYQEAVAEVYARGIVTGLPDGTFGGGRTLTRADGTVLLMRLLDERDSALRGETVDVLVHLVDASGRAIAPDQICQGYIGGYLSESTVNIPDNYTLTGSYQSVTSLTREATLVCRALTQAEMAYNAALDQVSAGLMSWEELENQDFWLQFPGENTRKYQLLFGSADKRRFASQEEASAAMTQVTVPVWHLDGAGNKVASTCTFTVHAALAQEATAIFTEIYQDPEQFPIYEIGGYSWRGDSATGEHNCGTALDLNANENCQVRDGQVLAGSLWQPGVNPYSIPADSSVVRIFAQHGWSWGGDAWAYDSDITSGYHDYMHFSYMGG